LQFGQTCLQLPTVSLILCLFARFADVFTRVWSLGGCQSVCLLLGCLWLASAWSRRRLNVFCSRFSGRPALARSGSLASWPCGMSKARHDPLRPNGNVGHHCKIRIQGFVHPSTIQIRIAEEGCVLRHMHHEVLLGFQAMPASCRRVRNLAKESAIPCKVFLVSTKGEALVKDR
jgi:hypothetical protein